MKSKLEYLLQSEGLTATSLARLLEIQPSGLSHILSGRNKPSFDLVVKILRAFPKINPDWLLLGSDKIYREDSAATPLQVANADVDVRLHDELRFDDELNIELSENEKKDKKVENCNFLSSKLTQGSLRNVVKVVLLYDDSTFESYKLK